MKTSRTLKSGATIGIAASASPFDRTKFMKGVHALEKLGFKVRYRHDIFDQNRYLAGTDARRAEEFTELLLDRSIDAVMFARGGYGSQRIIPLLDPVKLSAHPKPVIGFSDITALLAYLRQSCHIPTIYGPVLTQLGTSKDPEMGSFLKRALTGEPPLGELPVSSCSVIRKGTASGNLTGGCLSLINSSMGTPYALDATDSILFLEEINEEVYVLDRMLTQLKNSGMLALTRGIVFGSLKPPDEEPVHVEAMIRDVLCDFEGPVIIGFPAGHLDHFIPLPMGVPARLVVEDTISFAIEPERTE